MTTSTFITEEDHVYFINNNIEYNVDIPVFLRELRAYFNAHWDSCYFIEEEIASIDELNSNHLLNYPSYGGSQILDDSFTGSCPIEILSYRSRLLLGYLYDIHLR